MIPNSLYDCINTVECIENRLIPLFHSALKLLLKVDIEKQQCLEKVYEKKSFAWHRVKYPEKEKYRYNLEQRLPQMDIPVGAILCDDVNCANEDHKKQLIIYCEDLIQMCVKAGDECLPKVRKKESKIPYWNECVQP